MRVAQANRKHRIKTAAQWVAEICLVAGLVMQIGESRAAHLFARLNSLITRLQIYRYRFASGWRSTPVGHFYMYNCQGTTFRVLLLCVIIENTAEQQFNLSAICFPSKYGLTIK